MLRLSRAVNPIVPRPCRQEIMAGRHRFFALTVVAFTIAFLGCTRITPADVKPQAEALPPIYIKKVFPSIINDETQHLECVFPVENLSDEPITFTGIRKSCGCTDAEIDTLALGPREVTKLRMRTDLGVRTGLQRLTCALDDDTGRVWVFEMETTVYLRAHFPEHGVVHFGMVDPRSELEQSIEFRCHARSEAELPADIAFEVGSPHVSVVAGQDSIEKNQDGIYVRNVPLKIGLKSPADVGSGSTNLTAKYTLTDKRESTGIGVDWYVRPFVSIQPGQVYFDLRGRAADHPVSRRVVLKRVDGKPLAIKSVNSPSEGISCEVKPMPEGSVLLLFGFDPAKAGAFLAGEAVVEIDHPQQKTLRVPVAVSPR